MRTIIEPFRIKMTEPLKITTLAEREQALAAAHHNVFLIDAEDCCIDLLTDSGTGAMSAQQWGAMMLGDESYAGSRSWKSFESTVREITGIEHILPTHQGRAAEHMISQILIKDGDVVPGNMYFTTTRLHQELAGGIFADVVSDDYTHVAGLVNAGDDRIKVPHWQDKRFGAPCQVVALLVGLAVEEARQLGQGLAQRPATRQLRALEFAKLPQIVE